MDNLLKWNPSINSKCSNLEMGSSVCVGVIEGQASPSSPTKTATGIVTPTPTQTGMINGCTKFHPVKSTTTCQGILDYHKITITQFYKWNPAVKSDCSALWPNTYACVAGPWGELDKTIASLWWGGVWGSWWKFPGRRASLLGREWLKHGWYDDWWLALTVATKIYLGRVTTREERQVNLWAGRQ